MRQLFFITILLAASPSLYPMLKIYKKPSILQETRRFQHNISGKNFSFSQAPKRSYLFYLNSEHEIAFQPKIAIDLTSKTLADCIAEKIALLDSNYHIGLPSYFSYINLSNPELLRLYFSTQQFSYLPCPKKLGTSLAEHHPHHVCQHLNIFFSYFERLFQQLECQCINSFHIESNQEVLFIIQNNGSNIATWMLLSFILKSLKFDKPIFFDQSFLDSYFSNLEEAHQEIISPFLMPHQTDKSIQHDIEKILFFLVYNKDE